MPDNPFSGFAEGMNQGVGWAVQKNQLDNQRQSIEVNKQYLDENKRQFNVKVGKDFFDMVGDVVDEPSAKVRGAKIDALKNWVDQAGVLKIDEPFYSALNDEETYIPKFKELFQGMGASDPAALADYYEGLVKTGNISGKNLNNSLDKTIQGLATVNAAYRRQTLGRENLEFRQTRTGQQQYDTIQKPVQLALNGILRVQNLLDKGMQSDGSIKVTPQLLSTISSEQRKVEIGGQSAEGDRERGLYRNYETDLGKLKQYMSAANEGVLSSEVAGQIGGELKEMSGSYQNQHDTLTQTILGGASSAESKAIQGRSNAFRKSMVGKDRFQSWQGYSAPEAPAKPQAPSDENAPVNPEQMRTALQVKQKFSQMQNSETDADKKSANEKEFNDEMKKRYPKNVLKKLGIN